VQPPPSAGLTFRAVLLTAANTIGFGISFFLPIILARLFTVTEYGVFKQAFLVVGTALTWLPLGFNLTAYYYLPRETPDHQGAVVLNIIIVNAAVGSAAMVPLLFWPDLLALLTGGPELNVYGSLIGVIIFLWMIGSFLDVVAIAYGQIANAAVFILLNQLSKTGLMVTAVLLFGTLHALILAAVVQGFLQCLLLFWYLQSRFPAFWKRFNWSLLRSQVRYALPIGTAGLVFSMQGSLHHFFVSYNFGPDAYAIYSVGCFAIPLFVLIGDPINLIVIRQVSHLQSESRRKEIVLLVVTTTRYLLLIFLPLYASLTVLGRDIILLLFTDRYLSSWPIFIITLIALPFSALVSDPIIRAYYQYRYYFLKVRMAALLLLVPTLLLVTKEGGLVGVVTAVTLISVGATLAMTLKAWRIVEVSWPDLSPLKDTYKVVLAIMVSSALIISCRYIIKDYFNPLAIVLALAPAFFASYIAVLLWLRVISRAEIGLVLAVFNRRANTGSTS
jgi:O-antigen/teichoic acid export membrane protein